MLGRGGRERERGQVGEVRKGRGKKEGKREREREIISKIVSPNRIVIALGVSVN